MTFIIVFIVDVSGVIHHLNPFIWNLLHPNVKYVDWQIPLISCSLCSTFWAGNLYILINSSFNLGWIAIVCLLAFSTPIIKALLFKIKDLLLKYL